MEGTPSTTIKVDVGHQQSGDHPQQIAVREFALRVPAPDLRGDCDSRDGGYGKPLSLRSADADL